MGTKEEEFAIYLTIDKLIYAIQNTTIKLSTQLTAATFNLAYR